MSDFLIRLGTAACVFFIYAIRLAFATLVVTQVFIYLYGDVIAAAIKPILYHWGTPV